mgnify:CR=1 FL=1
MITIQFINDVNNDSLQVGDMVYFITSSSLGGFDQGNPNTVTPIFIGPLIAFTDDTIQVDEINPGGTTPSIGDFIMFGKDSSINISGLIGYFAEVTIKNNSNEFAEIYCLSSEITPSSK